MRTEGPELLMIGKQDCAHDRPTVLKLPKAVARRIVDPTGPLSSAIGTAPSWASPNGTWSPWRSTSAASATGTTLREELKRIDGVGTRSDERGSEPSEPGKAAAQAVSYRCTSHVWVDNG